MGRLLPFPDEGRHHFRRDSDRPARGLVDDRPLGLRANADRSVGPGELHQAVEPRALGRLADPAPGDDAVALVRRAQVIDLVPHHDPEVIVLVRGIGHRFPVRYGDLLDPLYPDGIVHMPELVDMLGACDQRYFEDRTVHAAGFTGANWSRMPAALMNPSSARPGSACARSSSFATAAASFPPGAFSFSSPSHFSRV